MFTCATLFDAAESEDGDADKNDAADGGADDDFVGGGEGGPFLGGGLNGGFAVGAVEFEGFGRAGIVISIGGGRGRGGEGLL